MRGSTTRSRQQWIGAGEAVVEASGVVVELEGVKGAEDVVEDEELEPFSDALSTGRGGDGVLDDVVLVGAALGDL
jgi:hypothetical protein